MDGGRAAELAGHSPTRCTRWTVTRSPACLPIALRSAALIGSLWVPSPSAKNALWNRRPCRGIEGQKRDRQTARTRPAMRWSGCPAPPAPHRALPRPRNPRSRTRIEPSFPSLSSVRPAQYRALHRDDERRSRRSTRSPCFLSCPDRRGARCHRIMKVLVVGARHATDRAARPSGMEPPREERVP
jgi:hypothetical protein